MRCKNPDLLSSRTIGLSFKDTICSRDLVLEECRKLGMKMDIVRSRRETKKSEEGIRFHSRYGGRNSSSGCYSTSILGQSPGERKTGNNGSGRKTRHPDIVRNILRKYDADFEQHFIEETFETPLGVIAQPDHVFARGNEVLVVELKRFEKKDNIQDIMQTKASMLAVRRYYDVVGGILLYNNYGRIAVDLNEDDVRKIIEKVYKLRPLVKEYYFEGILPDVDGCAFSGCKYERVCAKYDNYGCQDIATGSRRPEIESTFHSQRA